MRIQRVESASLFQTRIGQTRLARELCAKLPYVFITKEEPVKGHHTAYFAGVIVMRDYSRNPYVGDLWVMHEMEHIVRARAGANPDASFQEWAARQITDEFGASFLTEVLIYLQEPWLREETFDHPIWVDRILMDPTVTITVHPGGVEHMARMRRWEVIKSGRTPMDLPSRQIVAYNKTNYAWTVLWADPMEYGEFEGTPAFRVAEAAILHLGDDPSEDDVQKYLDSVSREDPDSGHHIPFCDQGLAFNRIYRENAETHGNHLFGL